MYCYTCYCSTFWSLGLFAKGFKTRVPTQITCQTFKEHPRALGLGRAEKYTSTECLAHSLAAPPRMRPGLQGPRSIAPIGGLSTRGAGARKRVLDGTWTCARVGAQRLGYGAQGFSSSLSLAKRRDPTWRTCSAPAARVRARSVTRAPSIFTAPSSILRLASEVLAVRPA